MEYEWDIDGIWESPQKIYLGMVYDGLPNVLAEIKW